MKGSECKCCIVCYLLSFFNLQQLADSFVCILHGLGNIQNWTQYSRCTPIAIRDVKVTHKENRSALFISHSMKCNI